MLHFKHLCEVAVWFLSSFNKRRASFLYWCDLLLKFMFGFASIWELFVPLYGSVFEMKSYILFSSSLAPEPNLAGCIIQYITGCEIVQVNVLCFQLAYARRV